LEKKGRINGRRVRKDERKRLESFSGGKTLREG